MDRPCQCDNAKVGQKYDGSQCYLCWLFHNHPRFHKAWGGTQEPSLLTKAWSLLKASVQHVSSGLQTCPHEVKEKRLSLCQTCVHFHVERQACLKCGCSMGIKTGWATSKCPLTPPIWGPYVDDENNGLPKD